MVTDTDRLFALKALEKRVKEEREELESRVRERLLAQYEQDGTDRMRSPYFGKDAGTYTYIPPKEEEKTEWNICDWSGLAEWLADNPKAAELFVFANHAQFGKWWLEETGEVPEGISRVTYEVVKPGQTRLSVKEDAVMEKLGENFFDAVNTLMLGDGSDD